MADRKYSDELKEQVIKEYREIGNDALVARTRDIVKNTVYSWVNKAKTNGSIKSLPKEKNSLRKLKID